MRILSIETSCDETAVTILDATGTDTEATFQIQGDALYSQAKKHASYGGVYPTLAKREHALNLVPLLMEVLTHAGYAHHYENLFTTEQSIFLRTLFSREAGMYEIFTRHVQRLEKPSIDVIAVTHGPGLEPALWVGINFARALAYVWNIPIIPVNHLEGHLVASTVEAVDHNTYKTTSITFPFLSLIISGGHTEFVYTNAWGEYDIIGRTLDDSIGEAFDKVARILGIPYPGGEELSRLAARGRSMLSTRPTQYMKEIKKLPRPMLHSKTLDFSFSGLKTAVLYHVKELGELHDTQRMFIATEFENAVSDVVIHKTSQALDTHPATMFMLGGGVSANSYIRTQLQNMFRRTPGGPVFRFPAQGLSTDNAIMIGMTGYFMHLRNAETKKGIEKLIANGNLSLTK